MVGWVLFGWFLCSLPYLFRLLLFRDPILVLDCWFGCLKSVLNMYACRRSFSSLLHIGVEVSDEAVEHDLKID